MLFNIYLAPVAKLIESYSFRTISYGDDTELLLTVDPSSPNTEKALKACLCDTLHV